MSLWDKVAAALIRFEVHTVRGIPHAPTGPLASPPAPPKPAPAPVDSRVKYTTEGLPYRETKPEGHEVSAWDILTGQQRKSGALTDAELQASAQKGFAVDTVILIKRLWAEKISQAEIAKRAGVSISTVKHLTPIFNKAEKTVQKGANK